MAAALLAVGAVQAAAQFVLDASLPKNPYGGTYTLSGGGPPPPHNTGSYQYSNGTYGITAGVGLVGSSVSLSGQVVFKYKWSGDPSSVPPQAIAHLSASASWTDGSSGGAASDGISTNDYHVAAPQGGTQRASGGASGDKWETVDVQSDGTFEVKLSPSASNGNGTASVGVKVEVFAATLSVDGTVLVGNQLKGLIGKQQTGSVNVSGLVAKNHTWSITGGEPFRTVQTLSAPTAANPSNTARSYARFLDVVSDPHPATKTFYASKPEDETVKCTVDLYLPNSTTKLATVTLKRNVKVLAPDDTLEITDSSGTQGSVIGAGQGGVVIAQAGLPSGVLMSYKANTPTPFIEGKVAICQKVQMHDTVQPSGDEEGFASYWLDSAFPYPGSEKTGGATASSVPDTPSRDVTGEDEFDINRDYLATSIYLPDSGGVYVPLRTWGWHWNFSAKKTNGAWGDAEGGITIDGLVGGLYNLENAEWSRVWINSIYFEYASP